MPYTCYTLVCSCFHRRSTQIPGWVFTNIWETLFTLLPWSASAHSTVSPFARSVFSQPKNPVRRTWSLHFWHHALYCLFWASTQCLRFDKAPVTSLKYIYIYIYIYPLEPREGHSWIGNQSPWSGFSDPFHRPAHSVAACFLRLPLFRWTFRWRPLFYRLVQSCRRVVACFLRLPYVKRRLGAAFLKVQCFSLSYYFLHLSRFAGMPLPPLIVRIRLEIWKEVVFSFVAFLTLFPAVSISCSRIALQTLHIP